jgi:hypothetical protein
MIAPTLRRRCPSTECARCAADSAPRRTDMRPSAGRTTREGSFRSTPSPPASVGPPPTTTPLAFAFDSIDRPERTPPAECGVRCGRCGSSRVCSALTRLIALLLTASARCVLHPPLCVRNVGMCTVFGVAAERLISWPSGGPPLGFLPVSVAADVSSVAVPHRSPRDRPPERTTDLCGAQRCVVRSPVRRTPFGINGSTSCALSSRTSSLGYCGCRISLSR